MAAVLNPESIIYVSDSLSVDNRYPIVAEVWCSDSSELPTYTQFDNYVLITGSKAILSNGDVYRLACTTWTYSEQSPYKDVYTKTEVNALLTPITDDITSLDGRVDAVETTNSDQDAYIYALICKSALNYLPDTAWEGATTAGSGYICQDLAVSLPAGDYIWKMKRDGNTSTSFVLKASDNSELYRVNRGAGVNDITQSFTISAAAAKVSIYAGYSINYSDNMIFKDLSTSNRGMRQINEINEEVYSEREEDVESGQDER